MAALAACGSAALAHCSSRGSAHGTGGRATSKGPGNRLNAIATTTTTSSRSRSSSCSSSGIRREASKKVVQGLSVKPSEPPRASRPSQLPARRARSNFATSPPAGGEALRVRVARGAAAGGRESRTAAAAAVGGGDGGGGGTSAAPAEATAAQVYTNTDADLDRDSNAEVGWAAALVQDMRDAFRSGVTRDVEWRKEQLRRIVAMVDAHEQEIRDALDADLGRKGCIAFLGDLNPVVAAKDAVANIDKWVKPRKVPTNLINLPGSSEVVAEPYGVVLIISPWNIPFGLALEPLVGAISAGNTVVLKPSEVSSASSALLARLLPQYLDRRAVRVVEGGPETAQALLDQRWDKIFFTGGTEIGRKVAVAAARHLTPVTLELGGKNPAYVHSSADLEVTARRLVFAKCINAGQACIAPDYVLVDETVADELTEALKRTMVQFFGEDASQSPNLARIVSKHHWQRIDALLSHSDVASRIVLGGQRDLDTRYIAPTLVRDVPWDAPLMREEIFGPICAIQQVRSADEAVAIVQDRPKPLALYVFSEDKDVAQQFVDTTSSGAVVVNDAFVHFSNPHLPFGGVGDSGMGSYHGGGKLRNGTFACFSHDKAVLRRPFALDMPLRYPPTDRSTEDLMRDFAQLDFARMISRLVGLRQ